jgi:hypothetical protein
MMTLQFGILFAHHPDDTDDVKAEKAAIFLVAVSCCFAGLAWSAMYLFAFSLGVIAAFGVIVLSGAYLFILVECQFLGHAVDVRSIALEKKKESQS